MPFKLWKIFQIKNIISFLYQKHLCRWAHSGHTIFCNHSLQLVFCVTLFYRLKFAKANNVTQSWHLSDLGCSCYGKGMSRFLKGACESSHHILELNRPCFHLLHQRKIRSPGYCFPKDLPFSTRHFILHVANVSVECIWVHSKQSNLVIKHCKVFPTLERNHCSSSSSRSEMTFGATAKVQFSKIVCEPGPRKSGDLWASQSCHYQENIIQPTSFFCSKDLQNSWCLPPHTSRNSVMPVCLPSSLLLQSSDISKSDKVPTICNALEGVFHSNRFIWVRSLQTVVFSAPLPLLLPSKKVVCFLINNCFIIIA